MLCNTSRTGLPAECHVFTIEPVFPSLLPHFDIRVFWITSTFLERIMLAIQGSTVVRSGDFIGGKERNRYGHRQHDTCTRDKELNEQLYIICFEKANFIIYQVKCVLSLWKIVYIFNTTICPFYKPSVFL
jgi:hypothetical protein